MRLVIDASTLVSESLRVRGRELLADASLDLIVASEIWDEAEYELGKRSALLIDRGHISSEEGASIHRQVRALLDSRLTVAPQHLYRDRLAEARWRIPRDLSDAPSVALALSLDCGVWTNDHDFFGCGLPVWATETLRHYLASQKHAAT